MNISQQTAWVRMGDLSLVEAEVERVSGTDGRIYHVRPRSDIELGKSMYVAGLQIFNTKHEAFEVVSLIAYDRAYTLCEQIERDGECSDSTHEYVNALLKIADGEVEVFPLV